ncbi:MAG TPA: hypothetical protein VHK06_00635, partial [Candidatus Limnocylindria bacterium]|nr:hypothetical protein [Candidatus Limnocylindria bacterium]
MRQVAGRLRLDLAQYRELAAFAQFASDLDKATRDQLTRGEKTTEVLKQPQFEPLPVEKQVAIIWTVTNGHLDDVETSKIREFEAGLYRFLESTYPELLPTIARDKALSDQLAEQLRRAVTEYRRQGGYGQTEAAGADGQTEAAGADGQARARGDGAGQASAAGQATGTGQASAAGQEAGAGPAVAAGARSPSDGRAGEQGERAADDGAPPPTETPTQPGSATVSGPPVGRGDGESTG